MDQTPQDRYIQTPSGRIHAVVSGKGEPLILVHGYSVEVNSWRTWERNLNALAGHFQVYALDMLGYGESDRPEPPLDVQGQGNALVQLLDAEKLGQANLIGLSWGGQVVHEVALGTASHVDKIVLVDSALDASPEGRKRLSQILQPTLIVWDEDDVVIPVRAAHALKAAIPNSQLEVLGGSERDPDADPQNRHWTQMTHSLRFNELVLRFLVG